jgi:RimJ/RimL family protein N-acetyltransferase
MHRGRLVALRPVVARDLDAILAIRTDPAVREAIMAEGPPETPLQHEAFFASLAQRRDRQIFAIASAKTDAVLGVADLYEISPAHRRAGFGLYTGPSSTARLSGISVEAELLLLDYAMGSLGLERVWGRVLSTHAHVVSMHQRFGFQVEGVLRRHRRVGEAFVDVIMVGLLAGDYARARPAIAETLELLAAREAAP